MAKKPKKDELAGTITIALGLAGALRDNAMANQLTNPGVLVIDTPGTIYAAGAKKVKIVRAKLVFLTGTFASTVATIQDGAGRSIAAFALSTSMPFDFAELDNIPLMDGLIVTGIGLGANAALYIYCE